MKIEGDKVIVNKKELVANILSFGYAVEILANSSGFSSEQWMLFFIEKVDEQLADIEKNRPEQIDIIIKEFANVYAQMDA
ncbi:MAG: hypothetical protein QNJ47_26965 [Nostocaceae cyanobacterium]|nr:hypothetical protein [Nostocaceae cyanobacterium]